MPEHAAPQPERDDHQTSKAESKIDLEPGEEEAHEAERNVHKAAAEELAAALKQSEVLHRFIIGKFMDEDYDEVADYIQAQAETATAFADILQSDEAWDPQKAAESRPLATATAVVPAGASAAPAPAIESLNNPTLDRYRQLEDAFSKVEEGNLNPNYTMGDEPGQLLHYSDRYIADTGQQRVKVSRFQADLKSGVIREQNLDVPTTQLKEALAALKPEDGEPVDAAQAVDIQERTREYVKDLTELLHQKPEDIAEFFNVPLPDQSEKL